MSNTVRIRTTPNGSDKYLKVNLEQDFDFIEILSLKISQEDTYRKFCSDYGVVVGRVSINNGFGVPNAKVSIFIPLDEIDKQNPLIKGLYPFDVVTDKDSDGIRYNLLPKQSETDNECFTPVGTFPAKREVLDNDTMLEVYCKYYKFTTTTNHAGDFMFFGTPLGSYTVHVDADISDIGIVSQRPYDFISQGTPSKLFESPTKFKGGKNINKLLQIKTLNSGVNIQPFWGDIENCQIGITRIDFDLNTNIVPAAIFMGSIYGDQHKHSINKRCRPRKKLGVMCEQVTGPGSINMIRKTLDGGVEEFSVEGGQLIDDNGTWAFQVPCNLDYMVTDEDGTLIFSKDPNIGIPTRARVRFNIGMYETGGEGRIRTRARYLVPNNPQNANEDDYTFGPETKDTSFKDLYWNKIYTVSNFISRFQKFFTINKVGSRSITGMKSVDECAGDKTPFPYNKVDTELNPIFFIICLIIKIIGFIIYIINGVLLPIINTLISAINSMMNAIVSVVCGIIDAINSVSSLLGLSLNCGLSWTNINYVGCITVTCPSDDGDPYAPGCTNSSDGFGAASVTPVYYPGDSFGHGTGFGDLVGLDDCIAFEMAKALNLFHFDFYNDWVNGTLFSFLLKYKKKKNNRELFCEYECEGSGTFTPQDGIDGNQNGVGDNDCHDNLLLDTCYNISNDKDGQKQGRDSAIIRDGLIKKVDGELYYAATTHFAPNNTGPQFKLFATDIVELGAVFNCDWQAIPKIQPLLIPTTYKIPPDTQEVADDNTTVEACGMVGIGGNTSGEFFSIDCIGLHVNDRQCLNLRHICEMGVEIDQALEDSAGNIISPSDCIIGSNDIDDAGGKWFRDVFTALNSATTTTTSFNIGGGLTTDFNTGNIGGWYDFTSNSNNGQDYIDFRGYPAGTDDSFSQSKHSYYFYFGILPGKTALDKMNAKFFTPCNQVLNNNDILISSSTTIASGATGTLSFTFIGGTGPFNWLVTGVIAGPPATTYGPATGSGTGTTLTGLSAGTYTITATDANGIPVTTTIIVSSQPPLYATVGKLTDSTTSVSNNGSIRISSVGGGVPPYQFELRNAGNAIVGSYSMQSLITPQDMTGLAVDNISGYKVTIQDSSLNQLNFSGITINGPNPLLLSATSINVSCYGQNNGSIILTSSGGLSPKTYNTTGPLGFTSTSNNMTALIAGTYVSTVMDPSGGTNSITTNITQPLPLTIIPIASYINQINQQCDPTAHNIPFYIDGVSSGISTGPINVEYSLDGAPYVPTGMTYTNISTPLVITKPNGSISTNIRIRFWAVQGVNTCYSNVINIPLAQMTLPPTLLTVSLGTIPNNCTPSSSKFNLNISHNVRAPYTIDYNIGSGALVGSVTTSSLTTLMNIASIPASNKYPNQISMVVKVTDSKGCVSPSILLTSPSQLQQVPAVALTCSVSTGAIITSGPNTGKYPHTVSGSGGIAPYIGTGIFYDTNTTYTAIITDTNGCTATATG